MRLNNRGSMSLIGLLVAVVIVVIVAAIYFGGGSMSTVGKKNNALLDSKSKKNTVFGKAMDTAKASDCHERLNQIRMGIANYKATSADDGNPQSFKDLGLGVSDDYFQCPVSNQRYTYDAAAGTVKCPTHTNF